MNDGECTQTLVEFPHLKVTVSEDQAGLITCCCLFQTFLMQDNEKKTLVDHQLNK